MQTQAFVKVNVQMLGSKLAVIFLWNMQFLMPGSFWVSVKNQTGSLLLQKEMEDTISKVKIFDEPLCWNF